MDPATLAVAARSATLPIPAMIHCVDCCGDVVQSPMVAANGTSYFKGGMSIYAFDRRMRAKSGWPFEPLPELATSGYSEGDGLTCNPSVEPAVAPDGTLYLSLAPASSAVGGAILAVGPDGRPRSGWPVKLARAGATFWEVEAGADGTAYGLVVEPEGRQRASATILAITPDGKIRYRRTIVEP